jgi:vacuolar-type H+-ATPase subunit E/Vma4
LQNLEKGLKEAKENAMQAKEEAEAELQQAKKDAQHLAESNLELEKQVSALLSSTVWNIVSVCI